MINPTLKKLWVERKTTVSKLSTKVIYMYINGPTDFLGGPTKGGDGGQNVKKSSRRY